MTRRILILVFATLVWSTGFAQVKSPTSRKGNLPYFERHKFHFGFTLGGNSAGFRVDYDLTSIDSLISIQAESQGGFNIGIVSSYRFNEHLTLRFLPTLAFAQRNVTYIFQSTVLDINETDTRIVESTYIMFPVLFKFRSARYNNFAAYMLGGGNFAYDLSSQFDIDNNVIVPEQVLKVQRQNWFAEVGFGTDFFLEYFKLSLELKYSHGLNDIFIKDDSYWAFPISGIKAQMITFSVHFEG